MTRHKRIPRGAVHLIEKLEQQDAIDIQLAQEWGQIPVLYTSNDLINKHMAFCDEILSNFCQFRQSYLNTLRENEPSDLILSIFRRSKPHHYRHHRRQRRISYFLCS